ncbi:MAG: hypothetical protein LBR64_02875 [Dysgonamonadaceae bacterium]|jgi:hypothetical protein|nr:hypothetical protein [Dysgonamonadaceae bacterium]
MKKVLLTIVTALFNCVIMAQTREQIEFINRTLDNVPYFERVILDYDADYSLPDSVNKKIIKALKRDLPYHFIDSIFTLQGKVLENIQSAALQNCKEDTVCYDEEYSRLYREEVEKRKKNYSNMCINPYLFLACGSWKIKEAIPYIEMEMINMKCMNKERKINMEMALAKLGNDSLLQQIKKSCSLSHLLATTELDSINNNKIYNGIENEIISTAPYRYYQYACYFRDKEFLYDMIDLLNIKGKIVFLDYEYEQIESILLMNFNFYNQFKNYSNYYTWEALIDKYFNLYVNSKYDKRALISVTSHSFKQHMISELKNWIKLNVVFE